MDRHVDTKHLSVPARTAELDRVVDFVADFLLMNGFDRKSILQISVAADEIFTNICKYAYGPEGGQVLLDLSMDEDNSAASIRFSDRGQMFDPLGAQPPDVTLPAVRRTEGGLGIFIARQLVSRIEYHYENGMNILTITKQKATEEPLYGNDSE